MSDEIDLSQLPAPQAVEELDFEVILAARVAKLKALFAEAGIQSDWDETQESDTFVKQLQESSYREMVLRARVNDGIRAVLLAYATGTDLIHLGAAFGVAKLAGESDDRFRVRIQLAPESWTTTGTPKAYKFHALSADVRVKDAKVSRPEPGVVLLTILSSEGDGTAGADLLDSVLNVVNADDVRPLCDTVLVQTATIIPYQITGTLTLFDGPDSTTVLNAAAAACATYAGSCHRLGGLVALSGIDAGLHQAGVKKAVITLPAAEIACDSFTAPYCTEITVGKADG